MVFLAAWYKAEQICSFFFKERHCFLISCTDFIDVKFSLTRGDEAEGWDEEKDEADCWMRNVFLLQSGRYQTWAKQKEMLMCPKLSFTLQ